MEEKPVPFKVEDVGIIGSYSSFLALMLIATVFAYRYIFDYALERLRAGEPRTSVEFTVYLLLAAFEIVFVVVPGVPIFISIRRAFKRRNRSLALILIFISCIYVFALASQYIYMVIEKKVPL